MKRILNVLLIFICLGYYVYMIPVIFRNSIVKVTCEEISNNYYDEMKITTVKAPFLIIDYSDNTKLYIDLYEHSCINAIIIIVLLIVAGSIFTKKLRGEKNDISGNKIN